MGLHASMLLASTMSTALVMTMYSWSFSTILLQYRPQPEWIIQGYIICPQTGHRWRVHTNHSTLCVSSLTLLRLMVWCQNSCTTVFCKLAVQGRSWLEDRRADSVIWKSRLCFSVQTKLCHTQNYRLLCWVCIGLESTVTGDSPLGFSNINSMERSNIFARITYS